MFKRVFINFSAIAFCCLGWLIESHAQPAPNFTITDTEGKTHNLYEDYLDQGYTVVIKIFFVDCPPCNAIAPSVQQLYEKWGEGQYDVQFIELSNKSYDSNADVAGYKAKHGITFPGAGEDGGALVALQPYLQGTWGPVFGTPHFAVISPDRSVIGDTGGSGIQGQIDALDAAIASTGATGTDDPVVLPAVFNLNITDLFNNIVKDVEVTLVSGDNPDIRYPLTLEDGYRFSITDLESEYPTITNPVLHIRKNNDIRSRISAIDILIVQRHILRKDLIDNVYKLQAADTYTDGRISALDLITIQRVILGLITEFPYSDTYKFIPQQFPLVIENGTTKDINFIAIKIGDLNGF